MDQGPLIWNLWRPLLALGLAAAVVMGSPGPSTMSAVAVGAAFGWRRSLAHVAGLVCGTLGVLLVVATGLASALAALPRLGPLLLGASAAYMLYLAYRIATAPPLSAGQGPVAGPSFAGGLLLAVANPKAYLAIAAVFAGAALPLASPAAEALAKTAVLAVMVVAIHLCWLLLGTALSRLLRDPRRSRLVNRLLAAVLVATTVAALAA